MARSRIRPYLPFGIGLLSVFAVLAAVAVPVVSRSDWWNTDTRVAARAPAPVAQTALPEAVRQRWSVSGTTSGTDPLRGSVVVVSTPHRIAGREVATGTELWHYQRDNATLCGWIVQDGAVVAAFRHRGGCSDLVALDTGTGQRRWYRNADLDADVTFASAPGVVVVGGSTSLTAFYTDSGLDRWKYTKSGCTFGPPVAGNLGVAVVLTCQGQAPLLSLHDTAGKDERWSVPVGGEHPRVLAVGDRVVVYSTYQGEPAVTVYNERGTFTGSVADPRLAIADKVTPRAVGLSTLVTWTGSRLVAVDLAAPRVVWSTTASGPPADDGRTVWYPDGDSLVERTVEGGRELRRVEVQGGSVGEVDRLARVGGLVVANGRQGTAVYG